MQALLNLEFSRAEIALIYESLQQRARDDIDLVNRYKNNEKLKEICLAEYDQIQHLANIIKPFTER